MAWVGWIGTQGGIDDPSKTFSIESEITKELLTCGAVLYCKVSYCSFHEGVFIVLTLLQDLSSTNCLCESSCETPTPYGCGWRTNIG